MLKHEIIDNQLKEWVVFIHGLGGSSKTWKNQIKSFSKKYNLLLLDLPGHGRSAGKTINKVDPQKLHIGIKETLDHLHIDHAHFVGMSLGTIVITNFAVDYPDYTDTIIFGGSALKLNGIYKEALILANGIKRLVPYEFLYKFFAWFMMPKKRHKKSRMIFLREIVKLRKETLFAWIEYLKFALHPDTVLARLDHLEKKILLISGDEDHCFIKGARSIANRMKNTEIRIINRCGHVCSIENWRSFNHIALDYLAALE
ncbi:MAG: alpha/beta hydrolase [Eubacteriales bacterium]|nr:alpha/beta hydrolase [Eubacteriales bacterium]